MYTVSLPHLKQKSEDTEMETSGLPGGPGVKVLANAGDMDGFDPWCQN